jgi:sugar lactone lactonase YvrE
MRPSRVSDLVAGRTHTGISAGSWCRVRLGPAPVARVALAACALTLALGATTAQALFLPLSSFGSPGSGAGQFLNPVGVAVDDLGSPGGVYVADSGNARVQKFDANGNFIAAWGWGVATGMAQSEVCTSNCLAGIAGSGPGQFSNPTSIGVDNSGGPSAGAVYVGDAGNNVVLKFDTNGNFLATIDGSNSTQGHFQALVGVAVDQIGHLWTADDGTDIIVEFDEQGNFVQQWQDPFGTTVTIAVDRTNDAVYLIRGTTATERFTLTGGGETEIDPNGGTALAVDPQGGILYVDHGSDVAVYDAAGTQIDSVTLITSNSQGLAFGTTAGVLYVSDVTADNVTIYGPPTTPGPPLIFSESATDFTESSVTLHATIVPFGLATTCQFQYVDDATFQASGYNAATSVPCVPADLGSGFNFVSASAAVSGLTASTLYHFRVVATNAAGTTNGTDMTFRTAGTPVVVSESASNITDTTATLNATINPAGFDTTCVFQYVNDAAFQASGYNTATSVDCSPFDLGSSFDPQSTSANVTGLTPNTTYHFRVVATNAAGTTNGADTTFQTLLSFLQKVSSFGSAGSGAGQFQTPVGVSIQLSNGAVYVADSGNARVQKFGANGNFLAAWGWGVATGMAGSEVCTSTCQAGIPGSGPGQLSLPTSIAVSNASGVAAGKVFVGDAGNNVVVKFDANGVFLATIDGSTTPQGHFVSLAGVAVDQSGNLWTADTGTGNVDEFDPKGKFLQQWASPSFSIRAIAVDATRNAVYLMSGFGTTERFTLTGGGPTTIDSGSGTALALDPQTGNLYVDHGNDVAVYDPTGTRIDTLFSLGATTNSQGLAFRPTAMGKKAGQNALYVSDASNHHVTIYAPPPAGPPFITAESARTAGKTSETLKASIVPLGFATTCTFQYVGSADFAASGYTNATTVPCTPANLGSSFTYQQASATVSGLTLGAFYHFRVVATNSAGTTTGADQTFQAGPGSWTPFTRCPVDDPAMLATDGVNTLGLCLASNSTHGSITIGNTTTATGNSNLQGGLVLDQSTSVFTFIAPPAGSLIADPATVTAGGVTVTATVESAGTPSDFDLLAGLSLGVPIITLPVKIHLVGQNVDLGPSCFIGSEQNPIVLHPENTDLTNAQARFEGFDPDGTPNPNGPLFTIVVSGTVQGDNTFAVPGATGCGPNGSLDAVVNAVVGLPSPAGANHLVLDDASSALAAPNIVMNGQQFSDAWHTAFDDP